MAVSARIVPHSLVVHVLKAPYDVYVGRAAPRYGLPQSPFANPFRIGVHGDRETVVRRYEAWLRRRPELVARARRELRGKVLACWCAPKTPCHAEVLARIANSDVSGGA